MIIDSTECTSEFTRMRCLIEALDRHVIVDNVPHDVMVKDPFLDRVDQHSLQHVFRKVMSVDCIP